MKTKMKKAAAGKTAAIYVRVSTAGQTDGISLERQESECRALAKRDGFKVVKGVYSDVMSGRRDDRPDFQRMLAAAGDGKFSRVYVWSVDRFARSLKGAVVAVTDLREIGVGVVTVKEGDLSDDVALAVLSAIAAREVERIRERTLPAKLAKRNEGLFVTGRQPYGYWKRADKSIEKCSVESRIVRRIFDDALAGLGQVAIARRLNRDAVPPLEVRVWLPGMAEGKAKRERPGHRIRKDGEGGFQSWLETEGGKVIGLPRWHKRSVARVLQNTAACGFLTVTGDDGNVRKIPLKIEGGPIVTPSEFDAAKRGRRSRYQKSGRRPQEPWLLTGKIVCGTCGANYTHHEGKQRRKDHPEGRRAHYYACNARRMGKGCTSGHVRMVETDNRVIAGVRAHLIKHFDVDTLSDQLVAQDRQDRSVLTSEIDALECERVAAKQQWDMTQDTLQAALSSGASRDDVPAMVTNNHTASRTFQALGEKIAAAQAELANLDAGITATAGEVKAVIRRIEDALNLVTDDGIERQETADLFTIVSAVLGRVTVQQDRSIKIALESSASSLRKVFAAVSGAAIASERLETGVKRMIRPGRRKAA